MCEMCERERSGKNRRGKIRNANPGTRSGPVRIATHHPPHPPTAETSHTFAVNNLRSWFAQGQDVGACIAVLATHLGHVSPVHTYWYYSDSRVIPTPAPSCA